MRNMKRFLCILLTVVMLVNVMPVIVFATENTNQTVEDQSDTVIEGTNGFGNLLSEDIEEYQNEIETSEEDYVEGYTVTDLTIEGNVAHVSYDSMEEALLVVALYTEDGMQMLCSVNTIIQPEETTATVTFEADMPEYFLASAYMVDTYDLSPLCIAYETPMYTQEMQELLASTVEDYDPERVLNLDDDNETNFAVYAESTIVIEETIGENIVASVDDENAIYVIEDADESIIGLREGDIFVYPYAENEILIAKVKSISVDGTTAIITGDELDMEDVFSQVKIEAEGATSDLIVDENTGDEGITYEGLIDDYVSTYAMARTGAIEGGASTEIGHKFNIEKKFKNEDDNSSLSLHGTINIKFKIGFSYFINFERQYIKFQADANLGICVGADGKISGVFLEFPSLGFSPVPGVFIGFEPKLEPKFSAKAEWDFSVSFTLGLSYENEKGIQNLCTKPKTESKLNFEGTIFFGIDLNPKISIMNDNVCEIGVSGPIGLQLKGKMAGSNYEEIKKDSEEYHACANCLTGTVSTKVELAAKIKFFKCKKLSASAKLFEINSEICKFYYSFDNEDLGVGGCPHYKYRVTITVNDASGRSMENIPVTTSDGEDCGKTNKHGITTYYVPYGFYTLCAAIGYHTYKRDIKVTNACKVTIAPPRGNSAGGGTSDGEEDNENAKGGIEFSGILGSVDSQTVTDYGKFISYGKCGENITWTLYENGLLSIQGKGAMDDYEYASPWESLGITEIVIDNGVTRIGNHAFEMCTTLRSIQIPNSVLTIGTSAFSNCYALQKINIPNKLISIGEYAFNSCYALQNIEIPSNVIDIGSGAFNLCVELKNIEFKAGVTRIADWMFWGCNSLESIEIPRGVTDVGYAAFGICDSLSVVKIPSSVTYIDEAFYECNNLEKVYIEDLKSWCEIAFEGWDANPLSYGCDLYIDNTLVTEIEIPVEITTIKNNTFAGCQSLRVVKIPKGVKSIGSCAFSDCSNLQNVQLSSGVASIEYDAFSYCNNLTTVEIPASVYEIGNDAFAFCDNLTKVIFYGDYPLYDDDHYCWFTGSTITVYYPADNNTWLSEELANYYYGGDITWLPYTLDENGEMVVDESQSVVVTSEESDRSFPTEEIEEPTEYIENMPEADGDAEHDMLEMVEGEQVSSTETYAIFGGEYETEKTETYTLKKASFTGLVPDQQYLILSMISLEAEDPLSAENLLYISQGAADAEGALSFQYIQREDSNISYVIACGASNKNLNDAEITFPDMIADGEAQVVTPTVVYDDVTLVEDQDYVLVGKTDFNEAGEYKCYVRGVRNYTGLLECTYTVVNATDSAKDGTCGEDLTWSLNYLGTLTISGSGFMSNYSSVDEEAAPWYASHNDITEVIIGENVTSIGECAFEGCVNLSKVEIPDSLTMIGDYAFSDCGSISELDFDGNAPSFGNSAFQGVTAVVYYPGIDDTWAETILQNYEGTITWTAKEPYKITYILDGGTNHSQNPASYKSSDAAITLQAPTKSGYDFLGWYADSAYKTKVAKISAGSTGNKILYANWTKRYTITYNLNGGTNNKSNPGSYNVLTSTTLLQSPTKSGYDFLGWYTDGTYKTKVTRISEGSTGNKTLYAKWTKRYTITYSLNGGTNSKSNPESYNAATSTITLMNPTKKGYTFKGWYKESTYKNKVTTIAKGSTGNRKLYAKWEKTKYTLTYNLNGGTNNKLNPTKYYVTSSTITLKNPTRKGYTFKGWYTESTYKNKVTKISKGSTGNKKLYAKWAKTKYTITYNLKGGTNSKSNPTKYYITSSTITLKNPTRKGYTFKGWYTESTYKNKVTKISKGSTGNKKLYAKWAKTKYTITYNLKGGTNSKSNPIKYYITSSTITLKNPTRKGYAFKGWYTESTYKNKITKITKGSVGNKTLYARWVKK